MCGDLMQRTLRECVISTLCLTRLACVRGPKKGIQAQPADPSTQSSIVTKREAAHTLNNSRFPMFGVIPRIGGHRFVHASLHDPPVASPDNDETYGHDTAEVRRAPGGQRSTDFHAADCNADALGLLRHVRIRGAGDGLRDHARCAAFRAVRGDVRLDRPVPPPPRSLTSWRRATLGSLPCTWLLQAARRRAAAPR